MSECPVPATARWSVSLWVHSHVNFKFYSIITCPCACDCKVVCVFAGCIVMSICKFYSIMTCLECPEPVTARLSVSLLGAQPCQSASSTQSWHVLSALCLWLQGCLCLCWVHSHVNLQVLLNHDMSWVPCAVRLSVSLLGAQPCQFASSTQSWHVWVPCACDCKVVCVFAGSTVMSICKFYSIMTCPECPVPAIARWSVSLLGAQSCQFVSSTQSWHVWVPCACDCKIVCVFAGSTVMSICKFCSIMKCLACPVPAIARWSVSLLGAQSCQFVSSAQSWNVLLALCLRLQGGRCLCWVHSHVNF